ncbi:MAG: hypothetical protein Q7S39_06535, partial [Ignavibacteria bacterium]|nr:hypothetical protein [Ignavibacteria bacterium]
FLLQLSFAFKKDDPLKYLADKRIIDQAELSLIKLGIAVKKFKQDEVKSNEYQTFARQSAIDAINNWYASNIERSKSLFSEDVDSKDVFYKTANGSGFCELSRLFFSKFTERYLKYFLEREASAVITNVGERNRFNEEIENHINKISRHAFETSKITQSFAAGWYNKNVKDKFPEERKIKGFLSYALGKMKSELLQEELK